MQRKINDRCLDMARYMVKTGATVRTAAQYAGISKSLAHRELTDRLKCLDKSLYAAVRRLLLYHKAVRHLRGGEATKRKFAAEKKTKVGNDGG